MRLIPIAALGAFTTLLPGSAGAQAVERGDRAILDMVRDLKPGQYVWAPELSSEGPALVVVNLETQRLILFRNGIPVAASTVSSGAKGRETPTGVFSILEKDAAQRSKILECCQQREWSVSQV